MGGASSYYQPPAGNGYHSSAPQQGSAYGPVYYAVNQAAMNSDYEVRKRAAFDALNEFFGDAKRRAIDPTTYYDVGHRLMALQGVDLPMGGGGGGGGYHPGMQQQYGAGGTMTQSAMHHVPQHQYSLPLPNLRTKNDLVNIDQFLEQLQSTVYENSNHAAAAGVAQPGGHYVHTGVNYRSSNSPPHMHASQYGSSHANSLAPLSASAADTPALTPASSVMSYTSGHSPNSVSGHNISPISRPSQSSMYPTLPSVSAMSDMSGNYSTSSAPASALATSFDSDGRRRYSGGLLQKAVVRRENEDRMDTSDDSTPAASPKERHDSEDRGDDNASLRKDVNKLKIESDSAAIDPALRSPGQGSDGSGEAGDKQQESWVENIRMIEQLRQYIKEKLERGEFDDADQDGEDQEMGGRTPTKTENEKDAESLYPVLRAVQGDA